MLTPKFKFIAILSALLLIITPCFSQDLIIKKDETKIHCKIIAEDSVSILYYSNKDALRKPVTIGKSEVQKYVYASREIDIAKQNKKMDSLNSEKYTLLHFNVFIGTSSPSGDFANTSINKKEAGFAKLGFTIQALVTLKLSKFIGINAMYLRQQYRYNEDEVLTPLNKKYPAYNFDFSASKWKAGGLFGGVYLTLPSSTFKNLYYEANILFGKPRYTCPSLSLRASLSENGQTKTQEDIRHEKKQTAFTCFFNVNFRYKVAPNVYVLFGADYTSAKVKFENVALEYSYWDTMGLNFHYSYTDEFQQKIRAFNLKAGLVLTVKNKKVRS